MLQVEVVEKNETQFMPSVLMVFERVKQKGPNTPEFACCMYIS
jgi:hypothetical protein